MIGKNNRRVKLSYDDWLFYLVVNTFLGIFLLLVLYPMIYIVSASFSSPAAVAAGRVILWPVDFGFEGYKAVFENDRILSGYANSLYYTVVGTTINVVLTLVAAYPLSRKDLPARSVFMLIFTFTMIFHGGMIPSYMLVKDLGIMNTRWAMVIPGAISVWNMIITRTFFQTNIPDELLEAARMDGCSDFRFFSTIVLPLSKAVIAVITLFYAVGHWNAFFNAFLYLNGKDLFPLQIILRDILVMNSIDINLIDDPELAAAKQGMSDLLKFSLIIVSIVPVLSIYPFVQKYFVKGVMIGSIKG